MGKIVSYKELVESFKGSSSPVFSSFENSIDLSYGELYSKILLYIPHLSYVQDGDKVIVFDIPSIDWVCIYFSVILRGGVVVPVDSRVSNSFLESVIENIKPALVISDSYLSNGVKVITTKSLQSAPLLDEVKLAEVDAESMSQILFTSGTWGIPKGVMLSQKNILTNAYQILDMYHHKKSDTSLALLPMSHAYQQTAGLIIPLLKGSHIVFLEKPDSFKIIEAIKKYNIKTIAVVPKVLNLIRSSILRRIKNKHVRSGVDTVIRNSSYLPLVIRRTLFSYIRKQLGESLENFIVGGALLSKSTDDFFRGLGYKLCVGYGLSETSPVISISIDKRRVEGEVGKVVKDLAFYTNQEGELIVSGDNVYLGYYPHKSTLEFNTGDVVSFDGHKNMLLKGRTKNLIIWPTGDKIFSEDLEYIIGKVIQADEVCVVHQLRNDVPVIYCAIKSDVTSTVTKEYINSKLPNSITLEEVRVFGASDFPYTHTLKPNRQKILELFTK